MLPSMNHVEYANQALLLQIRGKKPQKEFFRKKHHTQTRAAIKWDKKSLQQLILH